MALAIKTPTCFKCGKDLRFKQVSIGINDCKLPSALIPTGNVKGTWIHDGECVGETEEYKSIKLNDMDTCNFKVGDEVYYAGAFYEVAEIKKFPHGNMVGIYDEPPSKHIDYLQFSSVKEVIPCHNCQGGGCTVCSGFGRLIQ